MSSESQTTEKPTPPRDRIIDVAGPLFYREGYRAVGVDRVIAEAGVAKATFYKHFPAKDDLIVAWVNRTEERFVTGLPPEDGPLPLIAYADQMIDIAGKVWCMGCTYQGTAAEFSDPAHPAHAASMGVKRRVIDQLLVRARNQGVADPQASAERVFLFLEGVWAATRMFGADAPLTHAKDAIRKLIG
jgi:AcrR family transcriptional regulator